MSNATGYLRSATAGWPDGAGIIYLGMSPWDAMWKSRHQLMTRFAAELPVLYVEPPVSFRAVRSGRVGLRRLARDAITETVRTDRSNVVVMRSSAWYPISGSKWIAAATRRRWLRAVRRAAGAAGIEVPILWVSRPEMRFAVGRLGERLSIYHVVDEYAGYTGLDEDAARRLRLEESALLDAVDMAVAASPEIIDAKSAPGRDFVLLENGVSFRAYSEARRAPDTPADIAAIPRPRIGYSGLIGKRLNLELLAEVAAARPDWSIVMVGKVDDRECESLIERLRALPNVHFIGEKPGADVPRYVCSFDVGLLPYAINLETRNISPIKMYEYWAAGIPVIGTDIPSVQRNREAVFVAGDAHGFVSCIDAVLDDFPDAERAMLIARAEENAWSRRVEQVARAIDARLTRSESRSPDAAGGRLGSPSWKGN